MKPFKELRNWPRRVFFLVLVLSSYFTYARIFSLVLISAVIVSLELIFTRMNNNRRVINEFFAHYSLYKYKEDEDMTQSNGGLPKT